MIRAWHAIACICVLLALSGCGRKTPPIPPHAVIAVPIEDLATVFDDKSVTLSWTYPRFSESGARIDNIRTFRLFKSEVPVADYCEGCPVQFQSFMKLDAKGLKPGRKVRFMDSDLKTGHRYTYQVVSGSGWNISSEGSNKVSFWWESPLVAPTGLSLDVADQRLTLRWQEVTSLQDGSLVGAPVRYQVFRSVSGKGFSRVGQPVENRTYVDQGLQNDRKYFYQVRALRTVGDTELIGEASEIIAGKARDLTPPAPPHKFTVLKTAQGAKILWEDVGEAGVAGYRVYRRQAWQKEYILVGETGRRSFAFIDRHVPAGNEPVYYVMTAFDQADPPNESEFSHEVQLQK